MRLSREPTERLSGAPRGTRGALKTAGNPLCFCPALTAYASPVAWRCPVLHVGECHHLHARAAPNYQRADASGATLKPAVLSRPQSGGFLIMA